MQKGRLAGMNIITQNQKRYLLAFLYNFQFKNKPKIVYFTIMSRNVCVDKDQKLKLRELCYGNMSELKFLFKKYFTNQCF